jgi:adenylate kinase family enzyme
MATPPSMLPVLPAVSVPLPAASAPSFPPRPTPAEFGNTPRTAILGNSGSGKTSLTRALVRRRPFPTLDLDSVVWEPTRIAVRRPDQAIVAELKTFTDHHPGWIIEGCYSDLIEALLPLTPELIFLNPGRETCLLQCRQRFQETPGFAARQDQEQRLGFLLDWVAGYYTRSDSQSLAAHRRLFDAYPGPKRELLVPVDLAPH